MKNIFVSLILLVSLLGFAESAIVTSESALVYERPDFDSKVILTLTESAKIEVSKKKFGAFNRVRTQDGKLGFIADSDFKSKSQVQLKSAVKQLQQKEKPKRAFALTRYRGPVISYVAYKEETMGLKPTANSYFFGLKLTGPNIAIVGDILTDLNILLKPTAPEYYQQATGRDASGWILYSDLLFQSPATQGKNIISFYGFGPMFRYSHYDVQLRNPSTGQVNNYSLDDMVVGAVFDLGFGIRFDSMALRGEYKYYWEKNQYWGLTTSMLFEF